MECNAFYSIYPQYVLLPKKCVFRLICHYQIDQVFATLQEFLNSTDQWHRKSKTQIEITITKGIFISLQTENNYSFILKVQQFTKSMIVYEEA